MAFSFKLAYLVCGDDHGRIGERRARLRALAEADGNAAGAELLEGDACTPEAVVAALSAMTLAVGRRFVIADGVQRWGEKDCEPVAAALRTLACAPGGAPDTTVAFFAREEGRRKTPEALQAAVVAVGGEVSREQQVKPWELPKWVCGEAKRMGVELDLAAARALVAVAGERQQRLLRELERLALDPQLDGRISEAAVERLAGATGERKTWELADAFVAGEDRPALRVLLALSAAGERSGAIVYPLSGRARQGAEIAGRIEAGESEAQVRRSLRMPPRAAERLVAAVARRDLAATRADVEAVAGLELATRGDSALDEATLAVLTVGRVAMPQRR